MDVRTAMAQRCDAFLDEGEQTQYVVFAQSRAGVYVVPLLCGLAPIAMLAVTGLGIVAVIVAGALAVAASFLVSAKVVRYRILCWTDRALVVFDATMWAPSSPVGIRTRLPRGTPIRPLSGVWSAVDIGGERLVVHRRFFRDVEAAQLAGGPPDGVPAERA